MAERNKDLQQIALEPAGINPVPPTAFDSIAAALQQIHQKVTDESVPDDFLDLLSKFDALDDEK